ncbi:alpha/beta hydrolase [Cognatishimia sp. MH4019]|uniref:alpha/beta hydrolase n=1 Tax=Cognatishimia sp. MH4019 TaxID=2854030 RepID=UPI001CD21F9C|nr:alpha/beta fold hydrolase [Cognatishimia sp. MH4019]
MRAGDAAFSALRKAVFRALIFCVALACILLSLVRLEGARSGVEISEAFAGTTPVRIYAQPEADGPVVVVAHGFAGSLQLMEAYALSIAQSGYRVFSFDFEGHGRNPVPMSGDVNKIEGTTQRLIDETRRVMTFAIAETGWDGSVALLGHSMATDVIARAALADARVGPVIGISMFSQAVTGQAPTDLLMITGDWEPMLRDAAVDAMQAVEPGAGEGDTVEAGDLIRRAVVAPNVEHVGVLYSPTGLREAVAWLDRSYGRSSEPKLAMTGGWIALLLGAIVAMAWALAAFLPQVVGRRVPLETRQLLIASGVPAVIAPLTAMWIDIGALPVLVADYLMVHLLIYGVVQLAILRYFNVPFGRMGWIGLIALLVWGIGAFGMGLDRYAANFTPNGTRWLIVAVLALGTVPFMVADALTTAGGRAPFWHRLVARAAFFLSLAAAVALDFEGLFFLIIILPVILLFFIVYGLMGRWVAQHQGALAAGLGLGLILAWSLGVTFPLFSAAG